MKKLWHRIVKSFRIAKLRFIYNYENCENCGSFTKNIYTIPYIEAGFSVCKKCNESELNN